MAQRGPLGCTAGLQTHQAVKGRLEALLRYRRAVVGQHLEDRRRAMNMSCAVQSRRADVLDVGAAAARIAPDVPSGDHAREASKLQTPGIKFPFQPVASP